MTNKFVCGRLIINRDGNVRKLLLAEGGGTRDCTISHIDMGFEEIHDRLREIFALNPTEPYSKLYDFSRRELDTNRYTTFYEYVHKNGLKFKGTLLYLCTPADNEDIENCSSPEKRSTITPAPVRRNIPQVEADSSTPLIVIKTDDVPQRNTGPVIDHRIIENLRISSFSNYSFEKSLTEFIDYLRHLISQYHRENMLIQLFENICTIHGISSIILDRLKQQIRSVHEHEKPFYNDGLEKIEKLSRTVKVLIELNKMKISHIDQHSIISNSFNQFHQNFNILRDQWINNKSSNRQTTDYSIDPAPSTSFSRHHSETNSRKRTHPSSSSPHRSSSHRKPTEDDNNDKYSLFKNLLKSFEPLLDVLHQRRFTSFYYLVESVIGEIKSCRSSLKLSDYRSLYDAEQLIIAVEGRLTNRINDEYHRAAPHGINEQLEYSFDQALNSIRQLLNSFHHYKSQLDKHKRSRSTHHSSTTEEKPVIQKSTQSKPRIDDDQNSEISHSSIEDDVLMEVAKNAYEQRPNRSK